MPTTSVLAGDRKDSGPVAPFDILLQLKARTAEVHRQTERQIRIFEPGFNLADYGDLVERFYGYWSPLEARLAQVPALKQPELQFESRLKSELLRKDLYTLGRDPDAVPQCEHLPSVDTFRKAIGCFYVLEGSTLGAVFIAAGLKNNLRVEDDSGAAYFNAYGGAVRQRWSDFCRFVRARVTPADEEDIVAAAIETFQCFQEWLGAGVHRGTVR
jgi:heme oxygenase